MSLQPQLVIEPFEIWALDFVGPINPPSNQKHYILVYTNYMTKWVEAKALTRATKKDVSDFLFEDIFARYGIPTELVIDGRPSFTSHFIKELMEKFHIQRRMVSPYHPQENGKVESTNKVIEAILTKIVKIHCRDWDESLPEGL
jgi:transposase InsO family protein